MICKKDDFDRKKYLNGLSWRVRSVETLEGIQVYKNFNTGVNTASYNKAQNKIVAGCEDGTAKEWLVKSSICLQTFLGHKGKVTCAIYSSDDTKILSLYASGAACYSKQLIGIKLS